MAVVVDDFSPIYKNDTGAPFAPQFVYGDNTPVNLTGATIATVFKASDGTAKNGQGTWTIDDAANGKAHYVYHANDVTTPDEWELYITITIGGKPVHADKKTLVILDTPVVS